MRFAIVLSGLALAVACADPDPLPRAGRPGWPARPRVISPRIAGAAVTPPGIGAPRLIPGQILPPVVRGPRQTDAFAQDPARVDVLWVIDNSGSLNTERDRLARQFDRFLSVLINGGVDYHVGVTSTDLSPITGDAGRLRGPARWIDRTTADPRGAFRAAVTFPADSEVSLEEGLAAMAAALTPPLSNGFNAGFARDDAALAVIVVSDEDDGSLGPVAYFTRLLLGLKGPGREANISFSAVAGPLPSGCVPQGEENIFGAEAEAAARYEEIVDATGGLFESVCSPDFAPFVEALATRLAGLRRVFPLSGPPVESTIVVRVNGMRIPKSATDGWIYSASDRAVLFEGQYLPPPDAEIEISYDVQL